MVCKRQGPGRPIWKYDERLGPLVNGWKTIAMKTTNQLECTSETSSCTAARHHTFPKSSGIPNCDRTTGNAAAGLSLLCLPQATRTWSMEKVNTPSQG